MDVNDDLMARRGERIAAFLTDEAVQDVFNGLNQTYYDQWKNASDTAAREELWAKCRALDDLAVALQAVVDAGVRVTINRERNTRGLPAH